MTLPHGVTPTRQRLVAAIRQARVRLAADQATVARTQRRIDELEAALLTVDEEAG